MFKVPLNKFLTYPLDPTILWEIFNMNLRKKRAYVIIRDVKKKSILLKGVGYNENSFVADSNYEEIFFLNSR